MRSAQEGQGDSARSAVDRLLAATPPTDSLYPQILYTQAMVANTAADMRRHLQRVVVEHPTSPWADDALLRLVQMDYATRSFDNAARNLERLRLDYPVTPLFAQAAYWGGRTYLELKDTTRACRWLADGMSRTDVDLELQRQMGFMYQRCGAAGQRGGAAGDTAGAAPHRLGSQAHCGLPRRLGCAGLAAPPPATAPQPVRFRVQIAAVATPGAADDAASKAEDLGFPSVIVRERGLYKVRAGEFATRQEAQAAIAKLKAGHRRQPVRRRGALSAPASPPCRIKIRGMVPRTIRLSRKLGAAACIAALGTASCRGSAPATAPEPAAAPDRCILPTGDPGEPRELVVAAVRAEDYDRRRPDPARAAHSARLRRRRASRRGRIVDAGQLAAHLDPGPRAVGHRRHGRSGRRRMENAAGARPRRFASAASCRWSPLDDRRLAVTFERRADSVPALFADPSLALVTDSLPRSGTTFVARRPSGRSPGRARRAARTSSAPVIRRCWSTPATRSDYLVHPLPWSRTYLLVFRRGDSLALPIPADSRAFRAGLARDAVHAEARGAERPFWWEDMLPCPADHDTLPRFETGPRPRRWCTAGRIRSRGRWPSGW